jgi:flagellar protein FlaG
MATMSTEIQRQGLPRPTPELKPASVAPVGTAAAKPADAPQPAKVQIQVADPQEMARNLKAAIEQINNMMRDGGRGLNFVIDDTLNQPIIKVTRAETGEVIRQIPNEVVVRVAHNLQKLQGLLFSTTV